MKRVTVDYDTGTTPIKYTELCEIVDSEHVENDTVDHRVSAKVLRRTYCSIDVNT